MYSDKIEVSAGNFGVVPSQCDECDSVIDAGGFCWCDVACRDCDEPAKSYELSEHPDDDDAYICQACYDKRPSRCGDCGQPMPCRKECSR